MAKNWVKLLPKLAIIGQAASYTEANQIIVKNGKYLSQIIANIGNIRTSCPLYRKQIKNLSQITAKIGNNWTKVVLIWMLEVAKNGRKR